MSDHYHYDYAEARHDHRGDYAEARHDHDLDYAEKHHRHYSDESTAAGLREDLSCAVERIRELEDGQRDALERIRALEGSAPGKAAGDADLISLVAATAHEIANEHDRDCGDGKCTCTGGDPQYWENVTGTVLAAAAFHARIVPLTAGDQADEPGTGGAR